MNLKPLSPVLHPRSVPFHPRSAPLDPRNNLIGKRKRMSHVVELKAPTLVKPNSPSPSRAGAHRRV